MHWQPVARYLPMHTALFLCAMHRAQARLTGLSPLKTKVFYNTTKWSEIPQLKNAITLPQMLRNNGYRAVGAGKFFTFIIHPHGMNSGQIIFMVCLMNL
jgi:hypothetical protein